MSQYNIPLIAEVHTIIEGIEAESITEAIEIAIGMYQEGSNETVRCDYDSLYMFNEGIKEEDELLKRLERSLIPKETQGKLLLLLKDYEMVLEDLFVDDSKWVIIAKADCSYTYTLYTIYISKKTQEILFYDTYL